MKKIILAAIALLLISTSVQANEIAGTRVTGQGAVCSEGQRKGIEINTQTKEETSYCYTDEPIIVTATPISTPSAIPTPIPSVTDVPNGENTDDTANTETTITLTPTPTATPTPTPTTTLPAAPTAPPKSNVVIVDVSAGTTVIREETEEEWYERFLRMWSFFYEELTLWWSSFNA